MEDRLRDDKLATAQIYKSIILGENRKRRRGDLENSDDENDPEVRKMKRIQAGLDN